MIGLQQAWRRLALLAGVAVLAGFWGLAAVWKLGPAIRWLGLAGLTAGYSMAFVKRNLGRNRSASSPALFGDLGPGTLTTLMRGLLLAGVGGFLFSARPSGGLAWVPTVLFTTAELLDYLDGYLARETRQPTQLGEAFDLELDNLGMLIGSSLAVWYGSLPGRFLSIGLAGYLFRFGRWARQRAGRPVRELPPSRSRRPIAGLTMGFLSAVLWPIVRPPATTLAGIFFLAPLLTSFARDWLAVSGRLDPNGPAYRRARSWARSALLNWIPISVRAILVLEVAGSLPGRVERIAVEVATFRAAGFSFDVGTVRLLLVIEAVAALLIGLGIAGRAAAFLLVFPLGFTILAGGMQASDAVLLSADLAVVVLGTGAFSIWQPEVRLLMARTAGPTG